MSFIELPAVHLDDIIMDSVSTGLQLINRSPGASEIDVPVAGNIAVDIASLTGNAVDMANTQVFVNVNATGEVTAYDGGAGGFQAGWTGPESATSNPDTNTLRIVLDPSLAFNSLDSVAIRVASQDVGATDTIDETYTFTVQDITPPVVVAASALDLKIVRVSFDEAVKQVLASDSDDALNPSNYAFTPLEFPAVTPIAVSIASVSTTSVDITADIEFSMGKQYKVTVSGVADLEGNLT